ncbi:MAG: ATP-binding protein [Nitrosopumilus sp.]
MTKHAIDTNLVEFLDDGNLNYQIKKAIDDSIIIAVTDEDGKIIHVNDRFCKVSKYPKEELLGKNHRILKSGFHPPEFYSSIWKTISNGETWRGEIKNKAKDGSFYWVKTVIVPSLSKDGKKEYIAIRTEITARKELEEKLQQNLKKSKDIIQQQKNIEKAKSEFLSMISHELKTPLTPILAYLSALLDPQIMGKLSERQHKTIETIHSNTKQLQKIIDDIFYLQKLELGQIKFEYQTFLVDGLIQKIIDNYRFNEKVKFVKKVPELLTLESDSQRIEQILNNLVNNSLKFIDKNTGIIVIHAEQKDNYVQFSVRDNGYGIHLDLQKNLFKKFYQIDTSSTRERNGTGLGLSICKHTVEQLGGTIGVESEIGVGSTFHFTIPNNS